MKAIRFFTNSAGALLLATGVALLLANWASADMVQPRDPVLSISMRGVFWIFATLGITIAFVCLLGENPRFKAMFVLWLAVTFFIHQLGFQLMGYHRGFDVYLYDLAHTFGVSPQTTLLIVRVIFIYLFAGSLISVLVLRSKEKRQT